MVPKKSPERGIALGALVLDGYIAEQEARQALFPTCPFLTRNQSIEVVAC